METPDPTAELDALFGTLRGVIRKLSVSEDADHRTAGRSKKALELCKVRLGEFSNLVSEQTEQVHTVLNRIASELAAITNSAATPLLTSTKEVKEHRITELDNIVAKPKTNGTEWVKVRKGKKVTPIPISPSIEELKYDEVQVVPGYRRKCISISKREESLLYPGRICVIIGSGLLVFSLEDYIIPLWVPELQSDLHKPYKVIDHNNPKTVVNPSRNEFFIDPVQNSASVDTGNFLAQTHVRPISIAKLGGTQYCVRIGGSETVISDLAQCSTSQLAFARRYYLSGIMRALMIIDTERKIMH